ncbi:MAG: lysine--tRNA ligase [Candidatus Thorarchaeota archaeon]
MVKERKFWADRYVDLIQKRVEEEELLQKIVLDKGYICYDEKTPSGKIHIGSGRGWVIHDTVARALRDAGLKGRFILSADDLDPMDSLPDEDKDYYEQFMGIPFRFIPSPEKGYESYADYYFKQATSKFSEYGIEAELERTGDHYFNGDFNRTVKLALDRANYIQKIYSRFYNNTVMSNSLPFKPICEQCKKIGSTIAYEWDKNSELLKYRCSEDFVEWAKGCGHEGEISPYNGNGKLPWKVEWAAKWPTIGVVFETAGKDHFSAGGSRDVSIAISKEIFDYPPPFPSSCKKTEKGFSYKTGEFYEFFTIGGAKMSSSKGSGFPFSEMGNYAPGYIVKFLLVRTRPKSAIDFDPVKDLERVYRDYDENERKYYSARQNSSLLENDEYFNAYRLYELCHVGKILPKEPEQIEFNFGVMLVQVTDTTEQAIARLIEKGYLSSNISAKNKSLIKSRLEFLRKWVKELAPNEVLIHLIHNNSLKLSSDEKLMIKDLISLIKESDQSEKILVEGIKMLYTSYNISVKEFHTKMYNILFKKPSGPRLVPYIIYAGEDKIIDHLYKYCE